MDGPPPVRLSDLHPRFATACVTGTNGKTTTTTMIAAIVAASGERPARVTTLGSWVGSELISKDATSEAFSRMVHRAAEVGVKTLAIETTSQALQAGFAKTWPARVGVFTNLSWDHLDIHKTLEDYLAAKAQLFIHLAEGCAAVLNASDEASALLAEVTPPVVRRRFYAARAVDPACAGEALDLEAIAVDVTGEGTRVTLAPSELAEKLGGALDLRIVGRVHAENALAAAIAGDSLGFGAQTIRTALARFEGVPGRFQVVHREPLVVVDFAHTPDALERTLDLARSLVASDGQVVVVFGCGGNRDPGKRGPMGAIAARIADRVVITTDNPRAEDPEVIADAVEGGAREASGQGAAKAGEVIRIMDRREAIHRAIEGAGPRDIVVIAGKGHETTQIVKDQLIELDDAAVAREAVNRRTARTS